MHQSWIEIPGPTAAAALLLLVLVQQNLMPPCRCHLQVSRHLRAAAAEMHGLQCRDAPGAGHGPVLAPGSPGQEDH